MWVLTCETIIRTEHSDVSYYIIILRVYHTRQFLPLAYRFIYQFCRQNSYLKEGSVVPTTNHRFNHVLTNGLRFISYFPHYILPGVSSCFWRFVSVPCFAYEYIFTLRLYLLMQRYVSWVIVMFNPFICT